MVLIGIIGNPGPERIAGGLGPVDQIRARRKPDLAVRKTDVVVVDVVGRADFDDTTKIDGPVVPLPLYPPQDRLAGNAAHIGVVGVVRRSLQNEVPIVDDGDRPLLRGIVTVIVHIVYAGPGHATKDDLGACAPWLRGAGPHLNLPSIVTHGGNGNHGQRVASRIFPLPCYPVHRGGQTDTEHSVRCPGA